MTNLIVDIEDRKALMDMGKMGFTVMQGALEAGASQMEAINVLSCYYAGLFIAAKESNDGDSNDDT